MTILERLRANVSNQLVDPIKDDFEDMDWGDVDTVIKVDPASIALIAVTAVIVALVIIYAKKNI